MKNFCAIKTHRAQPLSPQVYRVSCKIFVNNAIQREMKFLYTVVEIPSPVLVVNSNVDDNIGWFLSIETVVRKT